MIGTMNTKSILPKNTIIMVTNTSQVPTGFSQETSLNGKFVKGIATASTEPNSDIGNANHTHASLGAHTHSATVASHSHGGTHSTVGNIQVSGGASIFATAGNHSHTVSTDSKSVAEATSNGNHTHDSISNEPAHRTAAFYKKTTTITSMNRKSLPRKIMFFYSKTALPSGFLEDVTYRTKHVKGSATIGTEAGSNTHQHSSVTHTHPVDISAHTHTVSFANNSDASQYASSNSGSNFYNGNHSHSPSTGSSGAKSSTPGTSGVSVGHTHDNLNKEPAYRTVKFLEVTVVKMSQVGVPKNCIAVWLNALNQIKTGWQVSDGTNGTMNLLGRYPKGDATPDSIGGSDTHTHSNDSSNHSHTGASVSHTHPSPTGGSGNSSTYGGNSGGAAFVVPEIHSHSVSTITAQGAQAITVVDGASNHTHGSQNHEPPTKTVAFIQRTNI